MFFFIKKPFKRYNSNTFYQEQIQHKKYFYFRPCRFVCMSSNFQSHICPQPFRLHRVQNNQLIKRMSVGDLTRNLKESYTGFRKKVEYKSSVQKKITHFRIIRQRKNQKKIHQEAWIRKTWSQKIAELRVQKEIFNQKKMMTQKVEKKMAIFKVEKEISKQSKLITRKS